MDILSVRFDTEGDRRQAHVRVRVRDTQRIRTRYYPEMPANVLRVFPGLMKHYCKNDDGLPFVEEMKDTELPHLLEHVLIEVLSCMNPTERFQGFTHWNWKKEPKGYFNITLNYKDEGVFLIALSLTLKILLSLRDTGNTPLQINELISLIEDYR